MTERGVPSSFDEGKLRSFVRNSLAKLRKTDSEFDPFAQVFGAMPEKLREVEERAAKSGRILPPNWFIPAFDFKLIKEEKGGGRVKTRLIGKPNEAMRVLHKIFENFVRSALVRCLEKIGKEGDMSYHLYRLIRMPSATAFEAGTSPVKNVLAHKESDYFYILDLREAYDNVNTDLLALLLTAIFLYDSTQGSEDLERFLRNTRYGIRDDASLYGFCDYLLYARMKRFIDRFCRGPSGHGLITGAPSSQYLFNLYCETMLDLGIRYLVNFKDMIYTRYADDIVVSRKDRSVNSELRQEVRKRIKAAGFAVNHRKSKVQYRGQGTIFITGLGLDRDGRLIFPGEKRRALHDMIHRFMLSGEGDYRKIQGHIAHFREYAKAVEGTKSDRKLLALCQKAERFARANGFV